MAKNNIESFQGASLTAPDGATIPLLKAAVESANDAIIITEAQLDLPGPRIEYVNPAFTRMTGYSTEEVLGKTPRLLQGDRTDRGLLVRLREDLHQRRSFHGETINYRKDGTTYHVEWRITPLFGADGQVEKWVAIQRDVTSRVRDQEEREQLLLREKQMRTEAELQSRMKDEFLATLSHELRTPLNAIVGWSALLNQDGEVPENVREGLDIIARNATAQSQLIEDLLDMSRIITGRIRLEVQRVDLANVIKSAIAAVQHAAEAKNVRLQQVIDPLAPVVSGDPGRLQQVVWNLLTNAVKFTPAGGRVQIVLERVNSAVELSVSDTGVGVRPDFLPHVFDRFRQQDSSTTRRQGGLGLGLAIVKHLTELHGGQVRAKSPGDDQGSTFIVSLPATPPGDEKRPEPPSDEANREINPARVLKGVRVLVVDDEPDARQLMRRLLGDCGCDVRLSASAQEALAELDEFKPQLLVSDIGMPNIDGYRLIQLIRQRPVSACGNIPAVAVTAFARSEDRRRALLAGFDIHIAKPIDSGELLAVLARLATRV